MTASNTTPTRIALAVLVTFIVGGVALALTNAALTTPTPASPAVVAPPQSEPMSVMDLETAGMTDSQRWCMTRIFNYSDIMIHAGDVEVGLARISNDGRNAQGPELAEAIKISGYRLYESHWLKEPYRLEEIKSARYTCEQYPS